MKSRLARIAVGDGSTWPLPELPSASDTVQWKLTWDAESLTKDELLYAACVLNAYASIVLHSTVDKRNLVVSAIRKSIRLGGGDA